MFTPNWDFWSTKKMSYDQRTKPAAGDSYGIGEGPKTGSMRQSSMQEGPAPSERKSPPKKVG